MKYTKKITAAALSVLLLGSLAAPASAEAAPSEKEEVIYIMTDASGKVTDMDAVNIFAGGNITDYGDYSAVKILNTTDKINKNGNRITFSSDAERVYYQGTMKNTEIPWNISVRYFLDGKEYSAKDIAGKSGALEIHFSVSKNENCKGSFYENYALQASFTLDTDLCKSIVSDGATVANVGSNKQLTYTVLPDKGIETVIKADVTDFEMDAVAINGVRLNMDFEVDDSVLTDKVNELVAATNELNSGTKELANGTAEFSDKTSNINEQISGEIDTMISSVTGNDAETVSFISEKNTNVSTVQFVIKTAAVKKSVAAADSAAAEAPLTFWQKLLRLFGLY